MNKPVIIVAVDGPSASGKSTVSRRAAQALGFVYVDSGAVYRGVTWKCVKEGVDVKDAQAVLQFTEEVRAKEILSLTATGRVREFRLVYRVGFRVHDGKGGEFLPANSIQLTRDVTFNDAEILAKEAEEALLYRDMQFDMVQQVMRRLEAAQRPKPAAQ